jgi:DNA-directed RNA polymerase sigma subunit (sigma70/sigma32)
MPTNHELAEITGVPADNVAALLSALKKPVSLDRAIVQDDTGSPALLECVPDADAQTALDNAELRVMVDQALARITPPRTALAVKLYYGVGDDEQDTQTMQEIGTKLGGISRERVRQLLANGESSLRRLLHDQPD